ncbi:YitT family protein [Gangjinia marincola]|uniref:YitT family protein n=1 Tax=Gangjinia marincola TaxID=578463 RepID=A0ABP3XS90_9FLAO
MSHRNIKTAFNEYLQIAFGIALASIGLKAFLLPNGFLDGGATGIALLLSDQFDLNISITLLIVSIPFLIIGAFTITKRILVKSILSIIGLSISISLTTFDTVTEDKLLIAIFGGLFLGIGIGLAIRNGSVLDGSELLGVFVFDRFGISIGRTILLFNVILFSITAVLISMEIAMYSILTYIVTAKVIDFVIEGFEDFVGFTIVSKKSDEVERALVSIMGVGVTIYKGERGYGSTGIQTETKIVQTIVNRIDIRKVHRLLEHIDKDAFIVEFDVNAVRGGVLRRYFQRKRS